MIMTKETRRTWAEIHLNRLAHNYRLLRERAPHSKFVGLVKANAYGHGAVPVAKKLEALGADYLAVACLDEAEQLRDAGIKCPILVLGYTPVEYTNELIDNDITQTVYSLEVAKGFSDAAMKLGKKLRCHLKADTGMSRLGVLCTLENLDAAARRAGSACIGSQAWKWRGCSSTSPMPTPVRNILSCRSSAITPSSTPWRNGAAPLSSVTAAPAPLP